MTIIKCKKCEHDIEIPSKSKECAECGAPVIGSINLAIKEAKLESKAITNERKAAAKTILALQKKTKKDILENGKIVNRKLVSIKSKAADQIRAMPADTTDDMMKMIVEQANKEQDDIFNAGTKDAKAIMKKHTDEVAKIAASVGIEPPNSTLSVEKATKDDKKALAQVKAEKFNSFIQYGTFFLITPLGMLTIEEYFPVGLVLIIAGFISLPPLNKKILSTFSWLSGINLMVITHVMIVAVLYKLSTLIS